jgi:galactokinase
VTETARTRAGAAVLGRGDLPALGALLLEGHESLRADYESTIPEADLLVTAAVRHGALGARLTGAGWGGAVVMLAAEGTGEAILERVTADFAQAYGRTPAAWSSHAGDGVRAEDVRGGAEDGGEGR